LLSSRVLCHSFVLTCIVLFFFFVSLISVGFSLVNVHVFVFHSILATFFFLFPEHRVLGHCVSTSHFILVPLLCFVCPFTSFILLPTEIFLKAKFLKSLPVFVGIASFAIDLQLFALSFCICFSVLPQNFSFCLDFLHLPP